MPIDPTVLETLLAKLPKPDVEAFFRIMKAVLEQISPTVNPATEGPFVPQDYTKPVEMPQTGWISDAEIKAVNKKITEAVVAQKYGEGFIDCIRVVSMAVGVGIL